MRFSAEERPSSLDPASDSASRRADLWLVMFIRSALVLAVVVVLRLIAADALRERYFKAGEFLA